MSEYVCPNCGGGTFHAYNSPQDKRVFKCLRDSCKMVFAEVVKPK